MLHVVSVSSDQAVGAARTFLSGEYGSGADMPGPVVTELHKGGVAALGVSYWDSRRTNQFSILVNARTGSVFAWNLLDQQGPDVHIPFIGKARAIGIALATYGTAGYQALSANLAAYFLGGDPQAAWQIDLGPPGPTSSGAQGQGTMVSVDAVKGDAIIEKPGASPTIAPCAPVSAGQAVAAAEKVSGVSGLEAGGGSVNGSSFYRVSGTNTDALVDSLSGAVDEVVFETDLPETGSVAVTAGAAQTAAGAFLDKDGYGVGGLAVSVTQVQAAGVSSYQVSWRDPAGSADDQFDVYVNAASGTVFAFLDRRQGVGLVAPLMGQTVATKLATAAIGAPVTLWSRATLALGFDSDPSWSLTFGAPNASSRSAEPTAWHNVWATVDAVTGNVSGISSNGPGAS